MSLVVLSSAGITMRNGPGNYSVIHGISAAVMLLPPLAVWRIRRGDIRRHARVMIGVFIGGMIIAGGFTLLPGRIMHEVIFGQG